MKSKAQVKRKIGSRCTNSRLPFSLNVTLDLSNDRRRINIKVEQGSTFTFTDRL